MKDGYAFEYTGADWKRSKDDDWEIVVYSPKGNERLIGGRFIDGSQVRVYVLPDGTFRAQLPR